MLDRVQLDLVRKLPGNDCCCECYRLDTDWACVSFGILLCLECAGRHRSLGVRVSFIRSIYLDTWSTKEIEILKHGGNGRFKLYLEQLGIGYHSECDPRSYLIFCQTDEAQQYKLKLLHYVEDLLSKPPITVPNCPSIDYNEDTLFSSTVVEMYEEEIDSCGNVVITTKTINHVTPVKPANEQAEVMHDTFDNITLNSTSNKEFNTKFTGEYESFGFKLALKALHETEENISNYAIVCHIEANSRAVNEGIELGDIVIGLNGVALTDFDEVMTLINSMNDTTTIRFLRLLSTCDIASAIKVSPRSRRRFSFQQCNHMLQGALLSGDKREEEISRNLFQEDNIVQNITEEHLSSTSSIESMNGATPKTVDMEAMEEMLLNEVEKAYLNNKGVHDIPISPHVPTDIHDKRCTGKNAPTHPGNQAKSRVPFSATPIDTPIEDPGTESESDNNKPHNLQVLMEEVQLELSAETTNTTNTTTNTSRNTTPSINSSITSMHSIESSAISHIKLRQASYNSWEYEVLFLSSPYGFTLSRSSALLHTNPSLEGNTANNNSNNNSKDSGVISKIVPKSKAAQQGMVVGDTVIAVNRVYTPTYDEVLVQLQKINLANIEAQSFASVNSGTPVPSAHTIPVIFLLRRSLSYFINNTTTMIATESRKLLDDTMNLSKSLYRTMSPGTPPISTSNNQITNKQMHRYGNMSSLSSGTASIILNTHLISPITASSQSSRYQPSGSNLSNLSSQENSPLGNHGILLEK